MNASPRILMEPGGKIWVEVMSNMPHPYPELSNRAVIASSWPEFYNLTKKDIFEKESVSFFGNILSHCNLRVKCFLILTQLGDTC